MPRGIQIAAFFRALIDQRPRKFTRSAHTRIVAIQTSTLQKRLSLSKRKEFGASQKAASKILLRGSCIGTQMNPSQAFRKKASELGEAARGWFLVKEVARIVESQKVDNAPNTVGPHQ
jgi:hypothetical protein